MTTSRRFVAGAVIVTLLMIALLVEVRGQSGRDVRASTESVQFAADGAALSAKPVETVISIWGRARPNSLTITVVPGLSPDVDAWRFALGSRLFTCAPAKRPDGWNFDSCPIVDNASLKAFVPKGRRTGLKLNYVSQTRTLNVELSRILDKVEPQAQHVALLWHQQVSADAGVNTGITAANSVVFAPHFGGLVDVLDAASGRHLSVIDTTQLPGGRNDALEVVTRDGYLYIATSRKGLLIYDVRNPTQPVFRGQLMVDAGAASAESFTNIHTLQLVPNQPVVLAVNQTTPLTDLRAIDVSNPAAPREIGRFMIQRTPVGLDIFHDTQVIERDGRLIVFLHSLEGGMFILDATDLRSIKKISAITWEGTTSHSGAPFNVSGHSYYLACDEGFDEGMTILAVDDLEHPRVVSRYATRPGVSVHNVQIIGTTAYVAYYIDGLRVFDLSEPTRPREIAHFDTVLPYEENRLYQGAWGVTVLNERIFVSDMDTGVWALRLTAN